MRKSICLSPIGYGILDFRSLKVWNIENAQAQVPGEVSTRRIGKSGEIPPRPRHCDRR